MASRICSFCKEKVKDNATICKHCKSGLPALPPKKWNQTWKGFFLTMFILGIFVQAFKEKPKESTSPNNSSVQSSPTTTENTTSKKENIRITEKLTVESDAQIFGSVQGRMDVVELLVEFVKAHGNTCDSVSAASDNVFSKGFTLKCNKYNYEYQILDKGGKWYLDVK